MLNLDEVTDDVVKSIAELANQAKGADGKMMILPVPGSFRGDYLIVGPDGCYENRIAPQPGRKTVLRSVDQIPAYTRFACDVWKAHPAVYYSVRNVQVILNESEILPIPDGSACVEMQYSKQFEMLVGFSNNRDTAWKAHKSFLQMLRIDFDTCIEPFVLEQTIRACEAYTIDDTSQVRSTVMRTRESLGKDVQAEMRSGAGEIPEMLVLKVRVFKDPALLARRQIVCKLDLDPANGGRFALLPFAEEVENAVDIEMAELGDLLRSSINGPKRLTSASAATVTTEASTATELLAPFVPVFYGVF